jgi:iron uptake system component EfeO
VRYPRLLTDPRLRRPALYAGGIAVVVALLVGVVLGAPQPRRVQRPATIEVSVSRCGHGWTRAHRGVQTLRLRNVDIVPAEAEVVEVSTGAVYGGVEGLAPGTTRTLRVNLGGGTYTLRCVPDGSDPVAGPRLHVPGAHGGGPAVVPVNLRDLYGPAKQYRGYVTAGLDALVSKTDELAAAARGGDRAKARDAWLPAHLAYERLGAVYGAFGDFDGEINGLPTGLPKGVHDKDFTGFHRVEYGLWHGEPTAELTRATDRLDHDVRALRSDLPQQEIDPVDLGPRAHEILEDSLRFQLTGAADLGSGTTLATTQANLDGTRAVLGVLRPLLRSRYPGLAAVDTWIERTHGALQATQRPDGSWTPLDQLDRTRRERVDGAAGELLERLAPVATICEPRRTP